MVKGMFWLGDPFPHRQLIGSQTYVAPLYTLPLQNHVNSQKYSPPLAKDDECSPITPFFCNFLLCVLFCYLHRHDTEP